VLLKVNLEVANEIKEKLKEVDEKSNRL